VRRPPPVAQFAQRIHGLPAKPIMAMSTLLIVIGGLPGTGKTSLARGLARALDAVHLRIDTIEQALRSASMDSDALSTAGYVVAYGVAGDNLALGRTVVAPIERMSFPAKSGEARIAHMLSCERSSSTLRPFPTSSPSASFQCPGPA